MGNTASSMQCVRDEDEAVYDSAPSHVDSCDSRSDYNIGDMIDDISWQKFTSNATQDRQIELYHNEKDAQDRQQRYKAKHFMLPGMFELKHYLWKEVILPLRNKGALLHKVTVLYTKPKQFPLSALEKSQRKGKLAVFIGETVSAVTLVKLVLTQFANQCKPNTLYLRFGDCTSLGKSSQTTPKKGYILTILVVDGTNYRKFDIAYDDLANTLQPGMLVLLCHPYLENVMENCENVSVTPLLPPSFVERCMIIEHAITILVDTHCDHNMKMTICGTLNDRHTLNELARLSMWLSATDIRYAVEDAWQKYQSDYIMLRYSTRIEIDLAKFPNFIIYLCASFAAFEPLAQDRLHDVILRCWPDCPSWETVRGLRDVDDLRLQSGNLIPGFQTAQQELPISSSDSVTTTTTSSSSSSRRTPDAVGDKRERSSSSSDAEAQVDAEADAQVEREAEAEQCTISQPQHKRPRLANRDEEHDITPASVSATKSIGNTVSPF